MRLLDMSGSYPLDAGSIDDVLMQTSPGNYALGYMDGGVFEVFYVDRSDSDLRRRLHEWVGMPSSSERYASSAKESWDVQQRGPLPAFDKECRNYDDFGGLDNEARPQLAYRETGPPSRRAPGSACQQAAS